MKQLIKGFVLRKCCKHIRKLTSRTMNVHSFGSNGASGLSSYSKSDHINPFDANVTFL